MNELVDKYIKEGAKEKLWYLVFDYGDQVDVNKIMDYYISIKSSYYVCELLSIAYEYLYMQDVTSKIIDTHDDTFIFMILNNGVIKNIVFDNFFNRLKKYLDEK